jgi:galectin-7
MSGNPPPAKLETNTVLPLPYLSKLDGQVLPGQSVVVKGVVTGPNGFDISLVAGPRADLDPIPFKLSAKTKDKKIILNNFKNGAWDKEEKKSSPLKEGEAFDIRIRAHDTKFHIYCNHKELCEWDYKQPLITVTHLFITGEIELKEVTWGGKFYPVPYEVGIEGGFPAGKKLTVSGFVEKKAKRFHVNLITARGGDIPLHIDVRLDEKTVVRNGQFQGKWGAEEREGKLPTERESIFDITIVNEPFAYQIYFNGNHFASFAHRADPGAGKGIDIAGDLELHSVAVK